jgi:exonuclease SbcC
MIEKVKLRNFQRHRAKVLVLSPEITTITGSTDAGKSALLRALRWALLNDKPNADFIRWGAKFAKVIALVNGFRLARIQRPGRNEYRMNKQVFRSFGTGVPDPIRAALACSEINFQGQHDPAFWFSLSPGEVSRQLNAVIDLSVIDEALGKVSASVRSASERKRLSEEDLAKVKEERRLLAGQRSRRDEFKRLEEAYEEVENLDQTVRDLSALSARISANRDSKAREKSIEGAAVLELGRGALKIELEAQELETATRLLSEAGTKFQAAILRAGEAVVEFEEETKGKNCPICMRPLP